MKLLTFQTLKKLNYLENFPEAIPYTTSYYAKDWDLIFLITNSKT